jgi:hypothetical protein
VRDDEPTPCPECGQNVTPEMREQQEAHRNPDHEFVCGRTAGMTHEVCAFCKADMTDQSPDDV